MITFRFTPSLELYSAFKRRGPIIAEVLRTKLTALVFVLQSKVVRKLTNDVLHVRSGILRQSVRSVPAEYADGGRKIVASVFAAEGPAFYGKIHERGGSRAYEIVSVKARALRFMVNGKEVYAKSVIHPPVKLRAFMGPSETENKDWILSELQIALKKEIK